MSATYETNSTKTLGVILLAGGNGTRMQSPIPKQYMDLQGKPVAQHSLDLFALTPNVIEIVIVAAPEYRQFFNTSACKMPITFALPGERRQDSVYNGLQAFSKNPSFICVHDTARPFITDTLVKRVIDAALQHGAATAAMPVKFTVKEATPEGQVVRTLERSTLWEIQTPQIIKTELLHEGFDYANQNYLSVTDDTSLVELLGAKVQLVEGSDRNMKLTTSEDFVIAQAW